MLQGIPASGKSTWCREFIKGKKDWVIVNRDAIRNMRGDYWIPEQETYISEIEDFMILKVYTPEALMLEEEILSITLKEESGQVTLKPSHLDYISSFNEIVVNFVNAKNESKIILAGEGIFLKCGNEVKLSVCSLEIGTDLNELQKRLEERIKVEKETEKEIEVTLKNIEFYILKSIMGLGKR
jgi:F0F1-type ATP synthase epsilon subunit